MIKIKRETRIFSEKDKQNWRYMGMVFLCVAGLFLVIQAASGLYPFGSKSNLLWDQDIQYVDYFAFYKDVLLGKANIGYSFSKSLGGPLVALFGYYLGCPLNLFVVFFSKEQMPLFIFLLTVVKLGLAGVTAQYFFGKRFPDLSRRMQIMLSVSYGLMQYMMIQLSNIMWLDGVILLPLLLWVVYRFAAENKKAGVFFVILFSIAINWYTEYMTGLFAVCYFIYERILLVEAKEKGAWVRAFGDFVRFGLIMVSGVLSSCFIFYPIVKGLQNGKQAFDLSIFTPYVNGGFIDLFRGFALGSVISIVTFYCGLLGFGFFLYYFICGRAQIREKILSIIAVVFMFVCCWFVPFECIWSGMRYAGSYRYRYSFVVAFLILYIAAKGAEEFESRNDSKKVAVIFGVCGIVFLLFNWKNSYGQGGLLITAAVLAVYCLLFLLTRLGKLIRVLIPVMLAMELVLNGVLTFQIQYLLNGDISDYKEYVVQSEEQIGEIKNQDDSTFYRMDTLQKRYNEESRCSAYLNESMVYGYHGINHYSSTYDKGAGELIDKIGYSTEVDLSIMSESSLPADSLFGVKYLLSEDEVPGYEKVDSIAEANGKSVYMNPYALSLGVQAADTVFEIPESIDPFEYQNQLYSNILGREVALYKKAEPEVRLDNNVLSFQIQETGEQDLLYGYIESAVQDLVLYVDGEYRCNYATWLSYKIFNAGNGVKDHIVSFEQYIGTKEEMTAYFYYLDQSVFEEIIEEMRSTEMETEVFEDGYVKGTIEADDAGFMLLTIPYDTGWTAKLNGEDVEIKKAADTLMAVPLNVGVNEIELKYHIPGVKAGILFSIIGAVLFYGVCRFDRRKRC